MTTREIWQLLFDLSRDASRGPADIGIAPEPLKALAESTARGSGDFWCVWLPEHEKTIASTRDNPEHAVTVCWTGNGPTSEANARFIAAVFHYQRDLLDLAYQALVAIEAKEPTP